MNKKTLTIVTIIGLASLFVGAVFSTQFFKKTKPFDPNALHATLFTQPRALAPFTLTTASGKTFTEKNLKGQWTLLFFGFTRCPGICPTTMNTLKKAYNTLKAKGVKPLPRIIMVSVDPDYDTPQRTHNYAKSFNAHFIGLSGTPKEVEAITAQLSVLYTKVSQANNQQDSESYALDHSGSIMLINMKGEWAGLFSSPHRAEEMVDDYTALLTHFG